METIIEVFVKDDYNLIVKFSDGLTKKINIKQFIKGGISNKLLEYEYFSKVQIDEFGGLSWENGFDICPNFLREFIEANSFIEA